MPYQSFPGETGDSDSNAKLAAVRLPDLAGKTFLDVGCNEGFFCFEALNRGARQVVGIDRNEKFIDDARKRAEALKVPPGAITFECRSWDGLPDQKFDVVLLLSALHYAADQAALIHKLCGHLTPDGVLILECGVVYRPTTEFVEVVRSIDKRSFPTMRMINDILAPYAFKLIGSSPLQAGDPIPRRVFHIRLLKPIVLIVEGTGYQGKTTFARMCGEQGMPAIRMDDYVQYRPKTEPIDPTLAAALTENFNPERIDLLYTRLSETKVGELFICDLVAQLGKLNGRILVVEGAIWTHRKLLDRFIGELERAGYYPWRTQRAVVERKWF